MFMVRQDETPPDTPCPDLSTTNERRLASKGLSPRAASKGLTQGEGDT